MTNGNMSRTLGRGGQGWVRIHGKRGNWVSNADGIERYYYFEPEEMALFAKTLEIYLHLYAVGTNARARVLYASSADGSYFATAGQVISNQTSVAVHTGSKTSDLGARGRVILAVSDSTGSAMVSVEAEVFGVWKPF